MALSKAYEEVIDFIASGSNPSSVVAFRPSDTTRERVEELLSKERAGALTLEESSELEHYLQLEHIMRLAKARAKQYIARK